MKKNTKFFDAIVVGAGHAGTETSLAIARAGYQVCLMTMDTSAIGRMSCNPAIGGLAKGHIVREIDALGGEMAKAIDATGIQFRMLNRSKGPAVWAPRAQADKKQYSLYMQRAIKSEKNIHLLQAQGTDLLVKDRTCYGIRTKEGEEVLGTHVVITTGTFLQGLIHVGAEQREGGRVGEKPAVGLSASLKSLGIELVRFKTGTPARLHKDSIDWASLEEQFGDTPPQPFSYQTKNLSVDQISCHITYTNEKTHQIIRDNLDKSPLYSGRIKGIGPRYCPSIEDKVVKFVDKSRHQIYLEPEGVDVDEIYVNGMSTSLPEDVQHDFIHSIKGLENAKFIRPGYAIEYDCSPPNQIKHSMETKAVKNLFLAGQINCTSGYEEAAVQGLLAGLNVIRKLRAQEPFILGRDEAYAGVLIDDLVTRGTQEPYRMLTSRAEFRLLLRQDNVDERLMKYGYDFGLIPKEVFEISESRKHRVQTEIKRLSKTFFEDKSLAQHLRQPEMRYTDIPKVQARVIQRGEGNDVLNQPGSEVFSEDEILRIETEVKYEGYIARQLKEVNRIKKLEKKRIPENFDFKNLKGVKTEAIDKLVKIRPTSIGQASRIPGINSCDLSLLAVYLERETQSK